LEAPSSGDISMFMIRILLVILLPAVYIYFRINSLLTKNVYKILFSLFYLLLLGAFPVTEIASHSAHSAWLRPLLILGYSSLPFLLYLFLVCVLLDIPLILNRLLKIIPRSHLKSFGIRKMHLLALFVLPALIVIGGRIYNSTIQINTYHIQIPRKSSPLDHLRIALVSDFHLGELTNANFMQLFVTKIHSLNADMLLIPGDVIEGDRHDLTMVDFEKQFRKIQTRYGTFASPGNHESHDMQNKLLFFQQSNIVFMADSICEIDHAFTLIGRKDGHSQLRKDIKDLIRTAPDSLPIIVLDHRPTDLRAVSDAGADLLLSGHTHEGQLFPLNYIVKYLYEISWGYKKIGQTHVFVTSGIQVWGPPVRTAGDAEILMIDIDLIKQ
jgi:uncharacterized protein